MATFITITICNNDFFPNVVDGPRRQQPNACEKLPYTFNVEQVDEKGYRCEGAITVNACYGRCQSKEISDWKFPYKRAHHPVCVTSSGVAKIVTMLTTCDPEAGMEARRYEYSEPIDCVCKICTTHNTSCESPQQLTHNRNPLVKLVASPIINAENEYENLE